MYAEMNTFLMTRGTHHTAFVTSKW